MSVFRTSLLAVLFSACSALAQTQSALSTSPTLIQSTASLSVASGASLGPIDLSQIFGLPGVDSTHTIVQMQTNLGPINLELLPATAKQSVANFLNYVNTGAYTNSIVHRTAVIPPTVPPIIQGGGFTVSPGSVNPVTIPTSSPIPNEYSINAPNIRGTIAMARTSDPTSATDQWFINTGDDTVTLGAGNGGGYAVFGRVIGIGMTAVVDPIAKLPAIQVPNLDPNIFAAVPVYNYSGTFTYANWVIMPKVAVIPIYPDGTSAPSVLHFTAVSDHPEIATASVSGKNVTFTGVGPGTTDITVSAIDSNGAQAQGVYIITVAPSFAIAQQPTNETVAAGSTAVLSVAATITAGTSYQWQLNNAPITGATSSHLVLSSVASGNTGNYSCTVTSSTGTALTSNVATLSLSSTADVGRLTNLSVITSDISPTQALTLGFVIGTPLGSGAGSLPVLLRAGGPALAAFSIADFIPDPTLTLFANGATSATISNQSWSSTSANQTAVTNAIVYTPAFPFAVGSGDSALVQTLAPGKSSIVLQSKSGASGSALGEVYEATPTYVPGNSHLINLSSLLSVSAGHILTGGFIISGQTAKTVLIRGVGPTLTAFTLPSVMSDPKLTLFTTGGTQLATNTGWNNDSQIATAAVNVSAFPLQSSADSALLITLPPGGYTAQVNSASGGGGNALVEVYEVP